jgi:hypothetical protein
MPAVTRNAAGRGRSSVTRGSGTRGRGGRSAAAGTSAKRPAAAKGKKKAAHPRSPSPEPDEEEELDTDGDHEEDDEDLEVLSRGGKHMTAREQEEAMKRFEEEFKESRRLDATNPSIRVTSISHNAWPSTQPNLDLSEANWKPWSQTLNLVVQSTPPLSLHLLEVPSPPDPSMQPNAFSNWNLNEGVVIAQMTMHISSSERDWINTQDFKTARQLFNLLKTWHTKLGISTQVSLINNALSTPFSPKVCVSDTLKELKDLND